MTAISVHVLLWHYFSPETYPAPTAQHKLILSDLEHSDLLYQDSNDVCRVTERGEAFVKMLLETPLPEKRWADPRKEVN